MNLETLNSLDTTTRFATLQHCCGSRNWVEKMLAGFPYADAPALFAAASDAWHGCGPADWLEAFTHHPAIGAQTADPTAAAEQSGTKTAAGITLTTLATGNKAYKERFGYIYIVCATGKSADEMLANLETRLQNSPEVELRIAMAEQEKITLLRLQKLLA
jgi:2-oxo-4-hydroxy-4-carboxy-5-ureidoimidazoline decarboxylase